MACQYDFPVYEMGHNLFAHCVEINNIVNMNNIKKVVTDCHVFVSI